MLLLWILAGYVIGAIIGNIESAIIGASIGGVAGHLRTLHLRLNSLEKRLQLNPPEAQIKRAEKPLAQPPQDPIEPEEHSPTTEEPLQATAPYTSTQHQPTVAQNAATIHDSETDLYHPSSISMALDSNEAPLPEHLHTDDAASIDKSRSEPRVEPEGKYTNTEANKKPLNKWLSVLLHSNPVLRVGVILVFMGTAFLLKYAAGYFTLSIEWRVGLVICASIAMLTFGLRIKDKNRQYSLIIQGAAAGLFYLTIFTAFARYHLISPPLAFVLLVAAVLTTIGLALYQNAKSLAVFSIIGGFAAPFLVSTGSGNQIILFSYYLVLNVIVLSIAWFRAWRVFNLIGFCFTFSVLSGWVIFRFSDEHMASTLLFAIAFFTLYFVVSTLFSIRQRISPAGFIDGTLTFGNPTILAGNLAIILDPFEYGLAWSFVLLGSWYGAAYFTIRRSGVDQLKILRDAFYVISLICFTLSIPFIFQSDFISASAWGLEGAAILWIALRQQQRFSMFFALLLQVIASLLMLRVMMWHANSDPNFLHYALIAAGGLLCSFLTRKESPYQMPSFLRKASSLLAVLGVGWWSFGGMLEMYQAVEIKNYWYACATLFWSASLLSLLFYSGRVGWAMGTKWINALPIGLGAILTFAIIDISHPLAYLGWLAWPVVLTAYLITLYASENRSHYVADLGYHHTAFAWILATISTLELYWQANHWLPNHTDLVRIALTVPAIIITLATIKLECWPFKQHRDRYVIHGGMPLISGLVLWWWMFGLFSSGSPTLFTYVPILNPLDIATAAVIFVVFRWLCINDWSALKQRLLTAVLFMTLNAVLFRTLHHWAGIPYSPYGLWHSTVAQTTVSITWSTVAVIGMWVASKTSGRSLWLSSAALLGIVTAKLLLVDLSNTGTLARIISFLGVGFLMLGIGYVSPLPSQKEPAVTQDPNQAS